MKDNSNLPININEDNKRKRKYMLQKTAKVLGYSTATLASFAATLTSIAVAPPLAIPSMVALAYSFQKLQNNTVCKSFKDLVFIAKKENGKVKITQDVIGCPNIYRRLLGLKKEEKIGFMQLQTLVGLSRFEPFDKTGNNLIYETNTHSVNMKTFRILSELGYIKNYNEEYLKTENLILPKLAFGNSDLKTKVDMYKVQFERTEKAVDITDEDLKRRFPLVFSKRRGLLTKPNFNLVVDKENNISIDYSKNTARKNLLPQSPIRENETNFLNNLTGAVETEILPSKEDKKIDAPDKNINIKDTI